MRTIFTLFVFFIVQLSAGQTPPVINPQEIDFGTIYIDTVKMKESYFADVSEVKEIWIKNLDEKALVIYNVNWGCGFCPNDYPKTPILKGDSGCIRLYCKSFGRMWPFNHTMTIRSTAGIQTVKYKGNFKYMPHLLHVDKYEIKIDEIKNRGDTITLEVTNISDRELILSNFKATGLIRIDTASIILKPRQCKEIPIAIGRGTDTKNYLINSKIYFYSSDGMYRELITIRVD